MRLLNPELLKRAAKVPLDVDLSDMSDEWVAGFLEGQVNALEYLEWNGLVESGGSPVGGWGPE